MFRRNPGTATEYRQCFSRSSSVDSSGAFVRRLLRCAAMVLFFTAHEEAAAQSFGDKKYGEYYEEEKKWIEAEAKPPVFPKNENLLEFDAGAATRNRYWVDGSSLAVGPDGVVRYVAVVRTSGGATNITFEGIRCSTRERKLYAFGREGDSWSEAKAPSWQPIRSASYQAVLYKEYFCPRHTVIFDAGEGIDALKRGGHPDAR